MIRSILLCALILAVTTVTAQEKQDKKDASKDFASFQGSWKLTKIEVGGKEPPEGTPTDVRFTFTGNKVSIQKGKDTPEPGTYSVDSKKDPNEIDLVGGPKNEKTLGIFKFDKDGKLMMSFVKSKPDAPRPKKFGEPEAVVIVLEKVKE